MISTLVGLTITGGTKIGAGQVGVRYPSMPQFYRIPLGLLSRWVAYAGGRLQSQDVYMGLEAINLDIVDGLFGI